MKTGKNAGDNDSYKTGSWLSKEETEKGCAGTHSLALEFVAFSHFDLDFLPSSFTILLMLLYPGPSLLRDNAERINIEEVQNLKLILCSC